MFRRKKKISNNIPEDKTNYPSGVCVHSESGHWFLKDTKKYKIISVRVLNSWAFPRVIETSDLAISGYATLGRLGFRDGTLISDMRGNVYIISESKRRRITTPDWFDVLGIDFNDAIVISDEELKMHPEGEVLK